MTHAKSFLAALGAMVALGGPVLAQAPAPQQAAAPVISPLEGESKPRLDAALQSLPRRGAEGRAVAVPRRLQKPQVKAKPKPKLSQLAYAERHGFKKASALTTFPAFYPGLGVVTVKPDTIPLGPWRTFDRQGRLISSIYMLGDKDVGDQKRWDYVTGLPAAVNHATFYHHNGHPGFDAPHYHLVLWHVSRKDEARVAK